MSTSKSKGLGVALVMDHTKREDIVLCAKASSHEAKTGWAKGVLWTSLHRLDTTAGVEEERSTSV